MTTLRFNNVRVHNAIRNSSASTWLATYRPRTRAQLRLFCFPFAGGSASVFRSWADVLPESIEVCAVQLPGRERRAREAPFEEMSSLVEALCAAIRVEIDRPFAVFGHSLGAAVAFEMSHALRNELGREPLHFFASARHPPHQPCVEELHRLSDDKLVDALRRMGGTPEPVLQNREFMRTLFPMIRADLRVAETYVRSDSPSPLGCPMTVFHGDMDPLVTRASASAWREHSTGTFTLRLLDAGHHFLASHQRQVVRSVTEGLRAVMGPTGRETSMRSPAERAE